jgi:ParB family chromosome partitioning protein
VAIATPIVQPIPLADLEPHPGNVRFVLDPASLAELADSIRASGVLQPLLVTPHGERFRIIAGHRRHAAAALAGLSVVPCVVQDIGEQDQLIAMISENVQRENLSPIEEARSFDRLAATGLSHVEMARRLGIPTSRVEVRLRLLALPTEVQELVHRGLIPINGAEALARVPNADVARRTALIAARGHWSVKKIEDVVERELKTMGARPPRRQLLWKTDEDDATSANGVPHPEGTRSRRVRVYEWLDKARGTVDVARVAQAAKRACTVCGMQDAESVCQDCPMLELLEQLQPFVGAGVLVPRKPRHHEGQ